MLIRRPQYTSGSRGEHAGSRRTVVRSRRIGRPLRCCAATRTHIFGRSENVDASGAGPARRGSCVFRGVCGARARGHRAGRGLRDYSDGCDRRVPVRRSGRAAARVESGLRGAGPRDCSGAPVSEGIVAPHVSQLRLMSKALPHGIDDESQRYWQAGKERREALLLVARNRRDRLWHRLEVTE
jgi:hypothetical protein